MEMMLNYLKTYLTTLISDNISKHYEITDDFDVKEKYLELR